MRPAAGTNVIRGSDRDMGDIRGVPISAAQQVSLANNAYAEDSRGMKIEDIFGIMTCLAY